MGFNDTLKVCLAFISEENIPIFLKQILEFYQYEQEEAS